MASIQLLCYGGREGKENGDALQSAAFSSSRATRLTWGQWNGSVARQQGSQRAAVINRGMNRPMLRHYYPAEASAEAESVEICSIRHLPRLRQ